MQHVMNRVCFVNELYRERECDVLCIQMVLQMCMGYVGSYRYIPKTTNVGILFTVI